MEFFNYSKNLIKQKEKEKEPVYKTNPFKQNKNYKLIWIERNEHKN